MQPKARIQFEGFSIIRSLIEHKEGETPENFQVDFLPEGQIDKAKGEFRLTLSVKVKDENDVVNLEIKAVGNYKYDTELKDDLLDSLLFLNAPALLFPYIRAYISTLTNLSGFDPITMPTMNISGLGGRLKENTKEV